MSPPVVDKSSLPDGGQLVTALFDDAPTPRMLIGRGGVLIRVNQALCTWMGYTALELTGASVRALNDPVELSLGPGRRGP